MSDIVIGFGGTGAKIVQAFLLMGAAGALRLERPVKILLVDQDKSNGSTLRAIDTLERYLEAKKLTAGGSPQPLNATFETYSMLVWQPLKQLNQQLGKYFDYDPQSTQRDVNSRLLEILYGRNQIKASLDHGFLGNPNIGAPVFADAIKFDEPPWNRLDEDIAKGLSEGGSRIVLCGSVFGGTGAAGIPIVAKLLRERHRVKATGQPGRNADRTEADAAEPKIILNLAMPYFGIRQVDGVAVQASGKDFLPNAKAALQYYHDQRYLDFCDAIFVLGEADMAPIEKACLGDREQQNPAHPLELFAACNIAHALSNKANQDLNSSLILTVRADRLRYTWEDLPVPDPVFVRARMGAFARFSFALLCFREALHNYHAAGASGMNQWLRYYFPAQKEINPEALKSLERLATLYLEWAGQMELTAQSMPNGYHAEWFDPQPIVEGEVGKLETRIKPINHRCIPDLPKLLRPVRSDEKLSERDLLALLNEAHKGGNVATGFGGLINSLYASCGHKLKGFEASFAARGGQA